MPRSTGDLGCGETLTASDVGLEAGATLPFHFSPGQRASPLVVSFPHVGLEWPASLGPRPQVSFPRNADYAVDRLYRSAESLGAATVRARFSRLVVDLNRAGDDVGPDLVPDHPRPRPRPSLSEGRRGARAIRNRGVVWRSAVGNIPLLSRLSYAEFAARIARFHRPYHRALEVLLDRRRRQFGYAVLLDAHSMPGSVAGDLVLGTRHGRACAPLLRERVVEILAGREPGLAAQFGARWPLSLAVDEPYAGGEIVACFGRPEAEVHALQLEISRAIYMDEYRLELAPLPESESEPTPLPRGLRSRAAQAEQRSRRRLHALVSAIDELLAALAAERVDLVGTTAAQ